MTLNMATSLHNLKLVFSTLTLKPLRKEKKKNLSSSNILCKLLNKNLSYGDVDPK